MNKNFLSIDPEGVRKKIVNFIREKVKEKKKDGIVFGLSGGLDSTTFAYLACEALDEPSKIHALYLKDSDSEKKLEKAAFRTAKALGIHFESKEITEEVKKRNCSLPSLLKATKFFPFLTKIFILSSKRYMDWKGKRSLYLYFLERKLFGRKLSLFEKIALEVEKSFDLRHIIRREFLEAYAERHNLLPIGCANRTEYFLGWFVKDGIDDLCLEPLLCLYKTQVIELAKYLSIEERILKMKASPDMMRGLKDEDIIGYPYERIDLVAFVIERDLPKHLAFENGISKEEFEEIKRIHRLSRWKRKNTHEYPSIEEDFRLNFS